MLENKKKDNASLCRRCKAIFYCQPDNISACQCATVVISKETQAYLRTTNYGCLCKKCLVEINQLVPKMA